MIVLGIVLFVIVVGLLSYFTNSSDPTWGGPK